MITSPQPDAVETVIDESAAVTEQGYTLTRIHRTPSGHTVRVRVARDHYARQSLAVAEVLSTGLTWTQLVDAPASTWHATTQGHAANGEVAAAALHEVATDLYRRAVAVLPCDPNAFYPAAGGLR